MSWSRRSVLAGIVGATVLAACGGGEARKEDDDVETLRYGDHPKQRIELHRATAGDGAAPAVVLVHGGFWQAQYDLSLMDLLVPKLLAHGVHVANIEYRSVGDEGGGWPGTFEDAAAAMDLLADVDGMDLARVVTIGHSAGGHLAVWLAGRHRLPDGSPGGPPRVSAVGAVAQAGVVDLVAASEQGLGGGAADRLLGGSPTSVPERYAIASPVTLVPLGIPVDLVHGIDDRHVPVDQSRRYLDAARAAGDEATLTEVPGDHFAVIDPSTEAWRVCEERVVTRLGLA